ncbi:cytochrome P450 monooxygenase [Pseudohyphozyma bogoriensis]|nr:cytochrome P450 monooxygenase [Pseudohyphozyma bogoriensis]
MSLNTVLTWVLLGPPGMPLLGNIVNHVRQGPRGLEWAYNLHKQWGDGFSITLPGVRVIDISTRPDWLEHIQKTKFSSYVKGKTVNDVNHDVLGNGIFNVDGATWLFQRKITSRIFTGNSFREVITPAIQQDLAALETLLDHYAATGETFDLQSTFHQLTLQSFCRIAFGKDIGILEVGNPELPFVTAFDFAQKVLLERFLNPFWKITELWSLNGYKMRQSCKMISDYAYSIIDERAEMRKDGHRKDEERRDLLALFMDYKDESGAPLTREQLRDTIVNLLIAGRDTTAQCLSWSFFRLIHKPSLLEPIMGEINEVVPGATSVDYDNLRHLHQMQALLTETLRLHPSIPKNLKVAVQDDVLPNGGPQVKAGDFVRWGDWLMGRQADIWGEDVLSYNPSRFIDETTGEFVKPDQWKLHAWNGGARVCLGQNLALLEMSAVISTIVKRYDLSFAPGWYETVEKSSGISAAEGDEAPL